VENERQSIVEELTPSQMEEETTGSLLPQHCRSTSLFRSSVPTDQKKKLQYDYGLLETTSLKEGAMW
jgi:hypothetical protein